MSQRFFIAGLVAVGLVVSLISSVGAPLIPTIAEDALNAVPEHLRGASLGCGATQWQTAVRVILPTAMSGVFAAPAIVRFVGVTCRGKVLRKAGVGPAGE